MADSFAGLWMVKEKASSRLEGGVFILNDTNSRLTGNAINVFAFSSPGTFAAATLTGSVSGTSIVLIYDGGSGGSGELRGSISDGDSFEVSGNLGGFFGEVDFVCTRVKEKNDSISGSWKGVFQPEDQELDLYIQQTGTDVSGIAQVGDRPFVVSGNGIDYPDFSLRLSMPNPAYGSFECKGRADSSDVLSVTLMGGIHSDGPFEVQRSQNTTG